MKTVTLGRCWHIISEPGDATRYDYYTFRTGPYDFSFAPAGSTFRFPQRLNFYDVIHAEDEEVIAIAEREQCNPWTVKECIRTLLELYKGEQA